jgi:branched-chain amino acid aminotransferase
VETSYCIAFLEIIMAIIQIEQIMQTHSSSARLPHDKKYEKGVAFANGKYCARDEAVMPIWDMGFLQSDATYEVATVSRGRYFRLEDHFNRFARSCKTFRLRNPYTNEAVLEIFNTMIRSTGLKDAGVLWFVTRGLPKPGADPVRDRNNPDAFENRFYAAAYPYGSITTQEERNRGLNLIISKKYLRIPPKAVDPTAKNFHWMDMKLSLFEARDHGKDWSVLTDAEGYLTEAPGANIFVIKDGELYTPDSGCLEGITRRTALDLAEIIGVRTHVEKVHARQLKQADDAFITSSAGGIMPVNSVDDIVLGGVEGPGELATRFHNLYWEKMWEGWKCSPVDYKGLGPSAVCT